MLSPWNSSVKDVVPSSGAKEDLTRKAVAGIHRWPQQLHMLCAVLWRGVLRSWEYGLAWPFDLSAFELKALFRQALEVEGFGQLRFGYSLSGDRRERKSIPRLTEIGLMWIGKTSQEDT